MSQLVSPSTSSLAEPHGNATVADLRAQVSAVNHKVSDYVASPLDTHGASHEASPPNDRSPKHGEEDEFPLDSPEDTESSPRVDILENDYVGDGAMRDIGKAARKLLKNKLVPFEGRILFVGCGAVAQCVIPLLTRLVKMPMSNVTVIDAFDQRSKIQSSIDAGVKFQLEAITKANLEVVLAKYLRPGDLCVDLVYEIPTIQFLEWCRAHDVMYINAALEVDSPYQDAQTTDVRKFTLYHRHMELEKRIAAWGRNDGPTAVIEHGANPGLVSHFVKLGLIHIAEKVIKEKGDENPARTRRLQNFVNAKDFPRLAQELGVKVIHVSERDLQLTDSPKRLNEFVNTWSPLGFFQEGVAPAELGWGTHEKQLPPNGVAFDEGPKSSICMKTKGMNTYVRSWVPTPEDSGDMIGMVVRHGESYTIPRHLSVFDNNGNCVYRPTCHYSYLPSNEAMNSLQELRMRGYKPQPKTRVLKDEITEGRDVLGCLLMGHDFKSWWIGSLLDVHESRELVPHQSATIVQVGIGFATALQWILANPRKGVCVPDDLPYDEIIREALPFLGPFVSIPVDWTPVQAAQREAGYEYRKGVLPTTSAENDDSTWQFTNFLIQ